MRYFIDILAPHRWVQLGDKNDGSVIAFGEVTSLTELNISKEATVTGIVDGQLVREASVEVPALSRSQFQQAAPYAIEEQLSQSIDELHLGFNGWRKGSLNRVTLVENSYLEHWLSITARADIVLDQLVSDYSLVPLNQGSDASVAICGDKALIRTQAEFAANSCSIPLDQIDYWLATLPENSVVQFNEAAKAHDCAEKWPTLTIQHWPFGEHLRNWLSYPDPDLGGNQLLTGKWRPRMQRFSFNELRLPLIAASLAACVLIAGLLLQVQLLSSKERELVDQMHSIIRDRAPSLDYITPGGELPLLQRVLEGQHASSDGKQLTHLMMLATPAFAAKSITIDNISFREDQLNISCSLQSLRQVEDVLNKLGSIEDIEASLLTSGTNNGATKARYKISYSES